MKISVKFNKSEVGEVSASLILERGKDDPAIISVDGMAKSFGQSSKLEINRQFGRHGGKDAADWADAVVADIKHQIDEYRTNIPADYEVEY